jgi:hypothetical protein
MDQRSHGVGATAEGSRDVLFRQVGVETQNQRDVLTPRQVSQCVEEFVMLGDAGFWPGQRVSSDDCMVPVDVAARIDDSCAQIGAGVEHLRLGRLQANECVLHDFL